MEFFTIGVYNSDEQTFFSKLLENRIDCFCDIRQRRGVRGAKYAFVNSNRLQQKLADLDIDYVHFKELAPTNEIREQQKIADVQNQETKKQRKQLGEVFVRAYQEQILNPFDLERDFIAPLESADHFRIVLFCVEEQPTACHRSLVADRLSYMGYEVKHLL